VISALIEDYPGHDYHILRRNCCHFADDFCRRLGVGGIPSWIHRLARVGAEIDTLLHAAESVKERVCNESTRLCGGSSAWRKRGRARRQPLGPPIHWAAPPASPAYRSPTAPGCGPPRWLDDVAARDHVAEGLWEEQFVAGTRHAASSWHACPRAPAFDLGPEADLGVWGHPADLGLC